MGKKNIVSDKLDILSFILILPSLYLLGEKKKLCFVIFSITNVLMSYVAIDKELYGLLGMNIVYFIFNIVNWIKWNKDEQAV
jgi:nicotinamide riboside transporter PnuC